MAKLSSTDRFNLAEGFVPGEHSIGGEVRTWFVHLLHRTCMLAAGPALAAYFMLDALHPKRGYRMTAMIVVVLLGTLVAHLTRRHPAHRRGWIFVAYSFFLAAAALATFGPLLGTGVLFMVCAMTVGVFVDRGREVIFLLAVLVYAAIAFLGEYRYAPVQWIRIGITASLGTWILASLVSSLVQRLEAAHARIVAGLEREREERISREHAERLLEQSRRIEALGRLAGGIAHDVNNSLAVILGNAELLHTDANIDDASKSMLGDILQAASASRDTVGQLLLLSHRGRGRPGTCDAAKVVEQTSRAFGRLLPSSIALRVATDGGPRVPIAEATLNRMVLNLMINARDALPYGGRIAVSVAASEGHCRVVVEDNGVGMEPETLERLFEPFFTTKEMGRGTGLGLALVDAQVRAAGGRIEVKSEPGHGTSLTLHLPTLEAPDTPVATASYRPKPEALKVLIAEDEPLVRRSLRAMLELDGHRVTESDNEDSARRALTAHGPFDVVITDAVMPNSDLGRLLAHLHRQCPATAVVVCSGWTQETSERPGDAAVFLPKPFSRRELREALASARGPLASLQTPTP